MLHPAVSIDGEPYWVAGYSAYPAPFPRARSGVRDLLAVTLMPQHFERAPVSAEEIRERALEFAFGASYLREATLLSEVIAEAQAASWPYGAIERRLRRLRTHLIDGDGELAGLKPETRMIAHLPFLERLRDLGRLRVQRWIADHGASVGSRSSANLGIVPAASTMHDKDIPAA